MYYFYIYPQKSRIQFVSTIAAEKLKVDHDGRVPGFRGQEIRGLGGPLAEWSSGPEDLRNSMMVKRWLTLSHVAERLQIDEQIIIQYLRDHQLRGFKIDDVWLILARDLNAFLESRVNVPSVGSAHDRKSKSRGKI